MTVEKFRRTMAETMYIPAGSELYLAFHTFSQETLKITAKLNGQYHTPDEEGTLKRSIAMSKKVLIISSSPLKGGNLDILCDAFSDGAKAT